MKTLKSNNSIKFTIIIFFSVLSICGCKKIVEIDAPVTSITDGNVYADDATAAAVLTGIYTNMSKSGTFTGNSSISLLSGLSADELTLWSGVTGSTGGAAKFMAYYQNALSANPSIGSEFWNPLYSNIYICNAAIEGLTSSGSLTPAVRKQLLGEAKFMRAFSYFYLVSLFGDVPLALSTDYKANALLARRSKPEVYNQVITDLKDAQSLLSETYLNGNLQEYSSSAIAEKLRPTKSAATALLSRVYLYGSDFVNAEAQATILISNPVYNLSPLNAVFFKNSGEAIWELQPVVTGHNTEDAWTFILPATGPSNVNGTSGNPVYLSSFLLNSFETGDQRRYNRNWIDSIKVGSPSVTYYFPYKYKSATLNAPVTEYLIVLRLAEQYLIRAEARAQQANITGAQDDLNVIRKRAGLPNTTASTQMTLLAAIQHERQTELFTEWGHRWFDLKRTGSIDAVMGIVTPIKGGGPWISFQQLYPIPTADISKDPNLSQNTGY